MTPTERLRANNLLRRALAIIDTLPTREATTLAQDIHDAFYLVDPKANLLVMRAVTEDTPTEVPPPTVPPFFSKAKGPA